LLSTLDPETERSTHPEPDRSGRPDQLGHYKASLAQTRERRPEDSMFEILFFEDFPLISGLLILGIFVFIMYYLIKDAMP
jgi:hypothetical protein